MRVVFLILGGAIGGGIMLQWPGAIMGFLLGLIYSEFFNLKEKINRLEAQLESADISEPEEKTAPADIVEPSAPVTEISPEIQESAFKGTNPTKQKQLL